MGVGLPSPRSKGVGSAPLPGIGGVPQPSFFLSTKRGGGALRGVPQLAFSPSQPEEVQGRSPVEGFGGVPQPASPFFLPSLWEGPGVGLLLPRCKGCTTPGANIHDYAMRGGAKASTPGW